MNDNTNSYRNDGRPIDNRRCYGDLENLSKDAKALLDILSRQGTNFVIDCLADYVGDVALRFRMNKQDRDYLICNLSDDFKNAICERL